MHLMNDDPRQDGEGIHQEDAPTEMYAPAVHPGALPVEQPITGAFGWALVVERGPRAGLSFVLGEGETTAGRDPESDIFLEDITVSRRHCKFVVEADVLRVVDMGSTNGTYVNGERRDDATLKTSDEVIVGKFHLIVARGDE